MLRKKWPYFVNCVRLIPCDNDRRFQHKTHGVCVVMAAQTVGVFLVADPHPWNTFAPVVAKCKRYAGVFLFDCDTI